MTNTDAISALAQRAMARESNDYLSKDVDELVLVKELKRAHGLERVYRFDIGKNTDGFSPLIHDVLETPELVKLMADSLVEYPENHYGLLRQRLAEMHGLDEDDFELGAGLESVLDQICRALLNPGDKVLVPTPNFDLFESSSVRVGAEPRLVPVSDDSPQWRDSTLDALEHSLGAEEIRLLWISNPVNPTGQSLPMAYIERLTEITRQTGTYLVVDEAYGEYTDPTEGVLSATRLLPEHPHLLVLRTFSKIHCLPSARVGYLASRNPSLRKAVNLFRPMFPFSWISLYMAQLALVDTEYLDETRTKLAARKADLGARLTAADSGLADYQFLDSDTNTLMFRHRRIGADAVHQGLARRGFLTANLNRLNGIQDQQFLRMTLHDEPTNALFLRACAEVAVEPDRGADQPKARRP